MMKATHLLSLLLSHGTLLATAEANSGYQRDDPSQLTLSNARPWLTKEADSESKCSRAAADDTVLGFNPLDALQHGLDVMQSSWFELWVGTWPTAIDWTRAVVNTHLVSSLSTLSKALESPGDVEQYRDVENDLNRYFSQNVSGLPPSFCTDLFKYGRSIRELSASERVRSRWKHRGLSGTRKRSGSIRNTIR